MSWIIFVFHRILQLLAISMSFLTPIWMDTGEIRNVKTVLTFGS